MRVLVCGGRNYSDREAIFHELHELAFKHGWLTIIEGGATGADRVAREWAQSLYHGVVTFPADWDDLTQPDAVVRTTRNGRRYDANAGPRRNKKMLVSGKPDLVIGFPGGPGTANMLALALVWKTEGNAVEIIQILG